ncbi:MAG: hypothetical protein M3320_02250 [Actinomycetota bacterium]|nr:hypothetical protein [Actinomycetota bacterium]
MRMITMTRGLLALSALLSAIAPANAAADGLKAHKVKDGKVMYSHGADPHTAALTRQDAYVNVTPDAPVCVSSTERRTLVVYVHPTDVPNNYGSAAGTIRSSVNLANGKLVQEGRDRWRDAAWLYSTWPEMTVQCAGGVTEVGYVALTSHSSELTQADAFTKISTQVQQAYGGMSGTNPRRYLVYVDAPVSGYCGQGSVFNDDRLSTANPHYVYGGLVAAVYQPCWSGSTALHEFLHNAGAVQLSAPHSSGAYHCTDGLDVMCYADGGPQSGGYSEAICTLSVPIDCGRDDYFDARRSSLVGSYLATHWNVGNTTYNRWLRKISRKDCQQVELCVEA